MATTPKAFLRNLNRYGWAGLLMLGGLGCGQKTDPVPHVEAPSPTTSSTVTTTSEPAVPAVVATVAANNPIAAVPETPPAISATDHARWNQPFDTAVTTDLVAGDVLKLPPDLTLSGKSTGVLHDEVADIWNRIALVDAAGKPIHYLVTIETELGLIEISLRPEWAPNHVRNFVALTRAGFYDGLGFDRIVHQDSNSEPAQRLDVIEGGCPSGTGEPGIGHLGYWLRTENVEPVKHEVGSVGMCLVEGRPETAGTRFYVALQPAPAMDGRFTVFGKVIRGLELLQQISARPVQDPAMYPIGATPVQMVTFRKVHVRMP